MDNIIATSNSDNEVDTAKKIILAETIDLGVDIFEVGIDQIMNEGLMKDIPILGSLVRTGKIVKSVHDAIFTKKVLAFAQSIHNGNEDGEKWEKHKEKLMSNPKELSKEIEVLLIYIDRYTQYIKEKILANFYILYFTEVISWDDFQMFAEVLDEISVFDLESLCDLSERKYYYKDDEVNALALKRLNYCGLANYFNGMQVTNKEGTDTKYYIASITKMGEYFCEFGLKGINICNGIS